MAIKGFSELLVLKHRETLYNDEIYIIEEIKKGCSRLEKLINDILKTAELKSGAVFFEKNKKTNY
jgi:signal transduction histidine kinase